TSGSPKAARRSHAAKSAWVPAIATMAWCTALMRVVAASRSERGAAGGWKPTDSTRYTTARARAASTVASDGVGMSLRPDVHRILDRRPEDLAARLAERDHGVVEQLDLAAVQ